MNKRITKIWGIGLIVVLLISMLGIAAPVSAGTTAWGAEDIPSTTGKVITVADVTDFDVAADGTTIWAAVDSTTVYKSTNAGVSWTAVTHTNLGSVDLIAIAPDDSNKVVAADSTSGSVNVYVTDDAGSTWSTLGTVVEGSETAALALTDLDVSAASSGVNYIAVSGYETGPAANVWYFNLGAAAPAWTETNTKYGFGTTSTTSASTEVKKSAAVAFSPNFPSDKVMTVVNVAYDGGSLTDNISFEMFSFSTTKKWNAAGGFTSYPKILTSDDGITDITSASIALSPTYLGSDDTERNAFIGLNVAGDTAATALSGIWRLKDTTEKQIKTSAYIHSVDYDGTNLIAGAYDTNYVYYSDDPMATTPTVSTARSYKRPGIDTSGADEKTVVAWAGSDVVAATSGISSAFAVSTDNGRTFNDISLISTNITNARDVAVSADGSKIYLVTDNGTDTSLWRYDGAWARVLTIAGDTNYIVRLAPDDPDVVYVAEVGGDDIYYSKDGGNDKWFLRTCGVTLVDVAVESADVLYAINSSASVSKSTNAGFTWGSGVSSKITNAATLVSVSKDTLLAGSDDGYVAYSTNGNTSWTKITKPIETGLASSGVAVQVVPDADYANNNLIYAAVKTAGKNVKKWEIGVSTSWTDIFNSTFDSDEGVYGLAVQGGSLYALTYDTSDNQSSLWQCIDPTAASSSSSSWAEKATSTTTDDDDTYVRMQATPQALKSSAGSNKLWAVKTTLTNKLYSITDTLAGAGPTLIAPANEYLDPVNTVTGNANEISFSWSRLSKATAYLMYIAYDKDFNELVTPNGIVVTSSESTVAQPVGPDRSSPSTAQINFMPGETYYWRLKVTAPLLSPYSETRSFTIEPGTALVPTILSPANGTDTAGIMPSFSWSPVSGATQYRFKLADNVALASPIVDVSVTTTGYALTKELVRGKTYYWAVKPMAPVEGGWSAISNFTVKVLPPAPTPPVVVKEMPAPVINIPAPPPPPPDIIIPPAPAPPAPIAPAYIWAIIIIGAVLVIAVIVLIVRTRRAV